MNYCLLRRGYLGVLGTARSDTLHHSVLKAQPLLLGYVLWLLLGSYLWFRFLKVWIIELDKRIMIVFYCQNTCKVSVLGKTFCCMLERWTSGQMLEAAQYPEGLDPRARKPVGSQEARSLSCSPLCFSLCRFVFLFLSFCRCFHCLWVHSPKHSSLMHRQMNISVSIPNSSESDWSGQFRPGGHSLLSFLW